MLDCFESSVKFDAEQQIQAQRDTVRRLRRPQPRLAVVAIPRTTTVDDASNAVELKVLNERTMVWPAAPINEGGASASPGLLRSGGAALLAHAVGPKVSRATALPPAAALRGRV